jgi:hypothetical protein
MLQISREIIVVVGKTGMGKTFWTRRYLARRRRVLIYDPMLEYEGELFTDMEQLIEHIRGRRFYQARVEFAKDVPALSMIAMAAGECQHRGRPMPHRGCTDVTLVIDEAARAVPSGGFKIDPAIEDVVFRGRHRHVTLVITTQRASTLSIAARSQWTRIISFWQTEPADVKFIESQAGRTLDLERLDELEYYEITPMGVRKKVIVPDEQDRRLHDVTDVEERVEEETE